MAHDYKYDAAQPRLDGLGSSKFPSKPTKGDMMEFHHENTEKLRNQLNNLFVRQRYVRYVQDLCVRDMCIVLCAYDANNVYRAFKWPKFAEGFVLKVLSHLEL